MRVTPWVSSVLLAVAVCAAPAMAAEIEAKVAQPAEAVKPQKSGDAAAGAKDGCPVHAQGMQDAMHKAGEPCPMMQQMGKMHEGCDVHNKKDCMEKHGEPCLLQHDKKHMSKQHEACATLKNKS
jgi:hypothetical protein